MSEAEVKVVKRGRWTRVFVEADGRDVSHLNYGPVAFGLGARAPLGMAGIGGVGTNPQYRRRGFARQVFARAMEAMAEEGYSCVGLHTGTDIVAHRLYRRFGFVDILVQEPAVKLLDPAAFLARGLTSCLSRAAGKVPEFADWRCDLAVRAVGHPEVNLRIEAGCAEVAPSAARADLTLTAARDALVRLWMGMLTPQFAEAGGFVRWEGEAEHWRRLKTALGSVHQVVNDGGEL